MKEAGKSVDSTVARLEVTELIEPETLADASPQLQLAQRQGAEEILVIVETRAIEARVRLDGVEVSTEDAVPHRREIAIVDLEFLHVVIPVLLGRRQAKRFHETVD